MYKHTPHNTYFVTGREKNGQGGKMQVGLLSYLRLANGVVMVIGDGSIKQTRSERAL